MGKARGGVHAERGVHAKRGVHGEKGVDAEKRSRGVEFDEWPRGLDSPEC